jgi:hypothetical protein
MIDRMKERATTQLSNQKDKATDGLGSVAQVVRQGTQQLRDQHHETIAGYVERAADQIDRFSQQLRDKDINELFDDAQRLARRRPAVFIGSAFALGVIGARFLKSSSRSEHDDTRSEGSSYQSGASRERSGVYGSSVYSSESNVGTGSPVNTELPTSATEPTRSTSGARATGAGRTGAGTRSRRTPGTERS